ncbi:MAG: hypothetical protein NC347_13800 [Clostridium sp.]|nr:hypothetical protein [Clostridium sp.]
MKKYMLLLPSMLYAGLFDVWMLLILLSDSNGFSDDRAGNKLSGILFLFVLAAFISGIVCNILAAVLAVKQKWDTKKLLRANLLLKYLYLPVNVFQAACQAWIILAFSVFGTDSVLPPQRSPLSVLTIAAMFPALFLWLGFVFHSGSIAIAGVLRAKADGVITKRKAVLYGIGSCIMAADIVVAHLLSRKVKKE